MAKVLVIDDEPDVRSVICTLLEEAGHDVVAFANGGGAIEHARQEPADLLITDIFMPESDGFEAIEAFRRNFPSTKIIAISGGAPMVKTNYLDAAGLIGVDASLQKPFEMDELLNLLRRMQ